MSPRKPSPASEPERPAKQEPPVTHSLNRRQRTILDAALHTGILVAARRFSEPAVNAFHEYCRKYNQPRVLVLYGQRRSGLVDIDIDYVTTSDQMTARAVEEVERTCAKFAALVHPRSRITYTVTPETVFVHHVPAALATPLVDDLLNPDLSHLTNDPEKDCGCLIPPAFTAIVPGTVPCISWPSRTDLSARLQALLESAL
jgi:hypothetical protein